MIRGNDAANLLRGNGGNDLNYGTATKGATAGEVIAASDAALVFGQ